MKKIIYTISAFAMMLFTASCGQDYDVIENRVFISDAQFSDSKTITIDDSGATAGLAFSLAKTTDKNVSISIGVNESNLATYNAKHGVNYEVLPEEYYSFTETSAKIDAGQISSNVIDLSIKPFDKNIDISKKWAIPVTILNADGIDALESSSSFVFLLDQVVVKSVPYLTNTNAISYKPESPMTGFTEWTLEWNLCENAFNRNNVTQWRLNDKNGKTCIYTRFGDVTCPQDQFQCKIGAVKAQSVSKLTAGKWYHLALVYDGQNIKLYIDGKLDFNVPYSSPGEEFIFSEVIFANHVRSQFSLNGKMSDLRLWSVARSQSEIENNMYIISGDTPGLEIYWKCGEGSGKIAKDSTPNGRDGSFKFEPQWFDGVRFPEN